MLINVLWCAVLEAGIHCAHDQTWVPMERSDGTRLVECANDAWSEYATTQWATDVGYATV